MPVEIDAVEDDSVEKTLVTVTKTCESCGAQVAEYTSFQRCNIDTDETVHCTRYPDCDPDYEADDGEESSSEWYEGWVGR